jgi:hypothetical protein
MSGGNFNYAYETVGTFTYDLQYRLEAEPELYSQPVMDKLKEIERIANKTAKLMKEVEWLYSGDTGEMSFMNRVKEIEEKF